MYDDLDKVRLSFKSFHGLEIDPDGALQMQVPQVLLAFVGALPWIIGLGLLYWWSPPRWAYFLLIIFLAWRGSHSSNSIRFSHISDLLNKTQSKIYAARVLIFGDWASYKVSENQIEPVLMELLSALGSKMFNGKSQFNFCLDPISFRPLFWFGENFEYEKDGYYKLEITGCLRDGGYELPNATAKLTRSYGSLDYQVCAFSKTWEFSEGHFKDFYREAKKLKINPEAEEAQHIESVAGYVTSQKQKSVG